MSFLSNTQKRLEFLERKHRRLCELIDEFEANREEMDCRQVMAKISEVLSAGYRYKTKLSIFSLEKD